MMPGFGSLGEAELSEALDQICSAEGVTRDKLVSVKIIDGEISVRHRQVQWPQQNQHLSDRLSALSRAKTCWAQWG